MQPEVEEEVEKLNNRAIVSMDGYRVMVQAPEGVKLTDEQFIKQGIRILMAAWHPTGGTVAI